MQKIFKGIRKKEQRNIANHITVTLNLIQSLFKATCPPLEGGPKSLISRRGTNALDCNQEPSPEFVSDKNRLDCFAFARNDVKRHTEDDSPKNLHTQNHVITRKNIEQEMQKSTQSDVVIPNELGNSETLSGIVTSLRTQKYK